MDRAPPKPRKQPDFLRISTMTSAIPDLPRKSPDSHRMLDEQSSAGFLMCLGAAMRLDCAGRSSHTGPVVMANASQSLESMTDEQLVGRLRGGDDAAFDALVARFQDKVYGLALR